MQTKPNKPEIFAGWQDIFPPINLNFTNPIWRIVKKATTFIEYLKNTCTFIYSDYKMASLQWRNVIAAVTVCLKAYDSPNHRFRLLTLPPHPSNFELY